MRYHDFRICVDRRSDGEYIARVESSPVGEMPSSVSVTDPLQIIALRSKLASNPSDTATKALGTLLFETLFTGDVLLNFREAADLVESQGGILRIQLVIEPNELSALPWELLYDPIWKHFLVLSSNTTLVRYMPTPRGQQQLIPLTPPLHILALFSSPIDAPPINIAHELHIMEKALQPLIESGLVELSILENATVWGMVDALRSREVHILYYQGHIGFNSETRASYLLLEDSAGGVFMKGMKELSYTLHRTNVRLAVINSYGMSAGTLAYNLVQYGIPGVVATQELLGDIETINFLQGFSRALAIGLPVDVAVDRGRRAIYFGTPTHTPTQVFWASPILVVSQLDLALFSLKEQS